MWKLEARPEPSAFWRIASPLLALVLTVILGVLLFLVLGKDPVKGLQVFFLGTDSQRLCIGRIGGQGDALVIDSFRAGVVLSLECMEHRR